MTTALRSVAHFYPGPWPTFTSALTTVLRPLLIAVMLQGGNTSAWISATPAVGGTIDLHYRHEQASARVPRP